MLFGKSTKQETSTDRGINIKKKCIEYVFEFKGKTGFEVPPPPSSVVLTPHCAHNITITQERYKIIKGIGKMYGGGGAYVSPIWYYDVQAQNHDALFLTGHFLVLFSIHVV